MSEVADVWRRLSHSTSAPLPPERQARLDEREALLRAEFDKLALEEKMCWQRSIFSKDAAELSTNPIVQVGTYIAWKIFKETGHRLLSGKGDKPEADSIGPDRAGAKSL